MNAHHLSWVHFASGITSSTSTSIESASILARAQGPQGRCHQLEHSLQFRYHRNRPFRVA